MVNIPEPYEDPRMDSNESQLRELAIEYTVRYFKDKQVSEEVFMMHLERTYNFLLTGKVTI